MPLAVYILALSVFSLGTSEFVISGLLPEIAGDLSVSIPTAGLLISGFAIGMLVGAPILAAATLKLPRKVTLAGALGVFIVGNALAALAPTYSLLFGARVVTALATAAFWAVGAATAVKLAPAGAHTRALAVMVGGLTVSNIIGVPLGTFIGQHLGWRAAFLVVAGMAAIGLLGVLLVVPGRRNALAGGPVESERPDLRAELSAFRRGRLWLALATTALVQTGFIAVFSYLTPLLTRTSGLPASLIPGVLLLFGLGNLVGITLAGRYADRHQLGTLYVAVTATILVLGGLAVFAGSAVAAVILAFLMGVAGMACAPSMNGRVFSLAGAAPTLASSVNVSAFNTGNTLGPWLGGLVIGGGLGYASTAWVGALVGVGALGLAVLSGVLDRRARRTEAVEAEPALDPVAA
ncbi:Cmx/CmrA family chloramphenicol efflux MFS transporter [Actinocatenispora rupis]|uniref:Chloramphenicol efflux pump n=1 Tax=Actinocatenispora rupis TaxID=519421 RepID=A0A8J3NEG8_9ACTN|nr:Cmx/CmrA family chloramphenicol efflux MFS transporter [Actinocatenispora rupis]GID14017.1 chloramphenicol efflux pump [Actinocatenispora rupis]